MQLIDRMNISGKVAVWGIGYLGYTTLLRCHQHGLFTHIYALDGEHLEDLRLGHYPDREIRIAWSEIGSVPPVSLHRMVFAEALEELFEDELPVHLIALPNHPARDSSPQWIENGKGLIFVRLPSLTWKIMQDPRHVLPAIQRITKDGSLPCTARWSSPLFQTVPTRR